MVPCNLLHAITTIYRDKRAKVVTRDEEIHRGDLQGDTLAPFLFVARVDYSGAGVKPRNYISEVNMIPFCNPTDLVYAA